MSLTDPRALLLLAAVGAALAGCSTPQAADGSLLVTPTQQFKAKVEEAPKTLALTARASGLSDTQRQAIAVYASQFREEASAELTLRVPQGVADTLTPTRVAAQVVTTLEDFGVPRAKVRVVAYDGSKEAVAPVVLSYWHYAVEKLDCANTWDNVGATGDNRVTKNFGCSTTANFAAMVADPRDILRPVAVDPADNSRRQVVLGKYRAGEMTATVQDEQASGVVSKASK